MYKFTQYSFLSRVTSMASLWRPSGCLWCLVSRADPWVERQSSAWLHFLSTIHPVGMEAAAIATDRTLKLCDSASAPWRTEDSNIGTVPPWSQKIWLENGRFLDCVNHMHTMEARKQNLLGCLKGFMLEREPAVFGKDLLERNGV